MNEIFKQYGVVAITYLVISIIMFFFVSGWGGDGVLNALGRNTKPILEAADKGDVDSSKLNTVLERDRPKVYVISNVTEKKSVYLLDYFKITDADDAAWNRSSNRFGLKQGTVYVMNITDSHGNIYYDSMLHINRAYDYDSGSLVDLTDDNSSEYDVVYDASTGKADFPLADTYTIKFRVIDCENVEATVSCRLAVDFVLPPRS